MKIFFFLLLKTLSCVQVPVTNIENSLYYIEVSLGTPSQDFKLALDTTSPWIWVDWTKCWPCHNCNKFNPELSSTFKAHEEKITIEFQGGIAYGISSTDYVKVEKIQDINLDFVLGTKDYDLSNLVADGVFGLSSYSLHNSFIYKAFEYGKIESPIFSLFLGDNGFGSSETSDPLSVLLIGEVDLNYTRDPNGIQVQAEQGWKFEFQGIMIFGYLISTTSYAQLSTSSEFIVGPKDPIIRLQRFFTAKHGCGFEMHGFLVCECHNLKSFYNISFIADGYYLELTPNNYFLESEGRCYLLFSYDENLKDSWVLGLPFLREFYTVFNYTSPSVTFYPAVRSRIDKDNSVSVIRWIIITITVLVIVVIWVSLYIIYALYCKNPHRWLNTSVRN